MYSSYLIKILVNKMRKVIKKTKKLINIISGRDTSEKETSIYEGPRETIYYFSFISPYYAEEGFGRKYKVSFTIGESKEPILRNSFVVNHEGIYSGSLDKNDMENINSAMKHIKSLSKKSIERFVKERYFIKRSIPLSKKITEK